MGPALLVLVVGVAATTSVASVAREVLIRPLPYPDQERIIQVTGVRQLEGEPETVPLSYLDIVDLAEQNRALSVLASSSNQRAFNTIVEGEAVHLEGEFVSAGYFPALGVETWAGRWIDASEDRRVSPARVVVVSHGLWTQRFGGRRPSGGERLEVDGIPLTIVGVMPAGFRGVTDRAEMWLPVTLAGEMLGPPYIESRSFRWLSAVGRLTTGADLAQAEEDLAAVAAGLAREYPETNRGFTVRTETLAEAWFGDLRRPLLALMVAATLVLLVTSATVSNLVLARTAGRRHELAMRAVVGASPRQLVALLVLENGLLALAAVVLALPLALLTTRLLISLTSLQLFSFVAVRPDPLVAVATALAALFAAIVFTSGPAVWVRRSDLGAGLQSGGRASLGPRWRTFQNALLIGDVAAAVLLLLATGLLADQMRRLREVDLGFVPENLVTLRLDTKGERYREDAAVFDLVERLSERIAGLPGVSAVAVAGPTIPTDEWSGTYAHLEGEPPRPPGEERILLTHHVTPTYFSTLGIAPVLKGRSFATGDAGSSGLAVVLSESAAEALWPGEDPVDRRLKLGPLHLDPPWRQVVGVVPDVRHGGLVAQDRPGPDGYIPLFQEPPRRPPVLNLLIRTEGVPPESVLPPVRGIVNRLAPDLPPYDFATMSERLSRQAGPGRFVVVLVSLFTLIVATLAAAGVYGLVSYSAQERGREIGIRRALGAGALHVAQLVALPVAVRTAVAVAAGAATAVALLPPLLSRLLFPDLASPGVARTAWIAVVVCGLVLCLAVLAALVPLRRAQRVDPAQLLR